MARTSPITIGLGVLMAVVLAAGVWLVTRPRHVEEHTTAESAPEPPPPAAAPQPAPSVPRAAFPPRPAVAPPPPAPPAAAVVTDDPSGGAAAASPPALSGRRSMLVESHNRRLAEADEEAFRSLNLDENTRARVRAINEKHRQQSERDANTSEARATARERLAALHQLLGSEGAQKFDAGERAALKNLRAKYRVEWGQLGSVPATKGSAGSTGSGN